MNADMMTYDVAVVGAGIVGLATAFELTNREPNIKVLIIEKEENAGEHQTGHNSGVIHSGIYYTPGSLKAKNCIEGYEKLLIFCDQYGIEYELCGKVIVATKEEELPTLKSIYERGIENGLIGLRRLNKEETHKIEPNVNCLESIYVPQAGIIDYSDVVLKLVEILKTRGVVFKFNTMLTGIEDSNEVVLYTSKQIEKSKKLITCGGLYSDRLAKMSFSDLDVKIVPFRGEYYKLNKEKEHMVKSLIYPVPNPSFPFLGVHYTRKKKGGIEAGPNAVLAFRREGYSRWDVNIRELVESLSYVGFIKLASKFWRVGIGEMYRSFSSKAFTKALKHLISDIGEKDLKRSNSGVRAQALNKDGSMVDDFLVKQKKNVIHVINAPSPAATSSLAIGAYISSLIKV